MAGATIFLILDFCFCYVADGHIILLPAQLKLPRLRLFCSLWDVECLQSANVVPMACRAKLLPLATSCFCMGWRQKEPLLWCVLGRL